MSRVTIQDTGGKIGITAETDPQVDDDLADNAVPRWDDTDDQLVNGNIYNLDNGNMGIGTDSPGATLTAGFPANGLITDISGGLNAAGLFIRTPAARGLALWSDYNSAQAYIDSLADREDYDLHIRTRAAGTTPVNAMTIRGNGRVGLGTADPQSTLDVNGDLRANIFIDRDDSRFSMEPSGGSRLSSIDAEYIRDRGDLRVDGNAGVGTPNPTARLHIRQGDPNDRNSGLYVQRAGSDYGAVMYMDAGGAARIGSKSDSGTDYNRDHIFLHLDNGNVGVGNYSLGYKLDVAGNVGATSYVDRDDSSFVLDPAGMSYLRNLQAFIFYDREDANYYVDPASGSRLASIDADYIRDRGNLDVDGNLRFSGTNPYITASSYFIAPGGAYFNSGTVYTEAALQARGGIHNDVAPHLTISGGYSGYTYFSGNVGVGTPTPAAKLDVNGDARINGPLIIPAGQPIITVDPPFFTGLPSLTLVRYAAGYGYAGYVTELQTTTLGFLVTSHDRMRPLMFLHSSGDLKIWGQYGYIVTSDDRVKFNEQKLEYGLAQVMALEPKRYDRAEWEVDPETEEIVIHPEKVRNAIGLVAQDVQKVIPEAVNIPEDENSELWGISYDTLVPVLVKAIQDQQEQIESLKQRLGTLEQR